MIRSLLLVPIMIGVLIFHVFVSPNGAWRMIVVDTYLLLLIVLLLFGERRLAVIGAIVGGCIVDTISVGPYGVTLMSYAASLGVTQWLFQSRITNRSFFAFTALIFLGISFGAITAVIASWLLNFLMIQNLDQRLSLDWVQFVSLGLLESIILSSLMYLGVRLSGRNYATLAKHNF